MSPYGERVARLEERVIEMDAKMARIESKLDDLLVLKNKGAGAFWLISIIFGTGVIGTILELMRWLK